MQALSQRWSPHRSNLRTISHRYRPRLERLEPRLAPADLGLAPTEIPFAIVGQSYTQAIQAFGPTADSTEEYTFTNPATVDGLTLSPQGATLTISGSPTAAGSFPFTVSVTDTVGDSGSVDYTLNVGTAVVSGINLFLNGNPPTATLPAAVAGSPYGQLLNAAGGSGDYTFSTPSTVDGLTFFPYHDTLTFSGTPLIAGSFPFTINTQDTAGDSGSQPFTLTVSMSLAPTQSANVAPGIQGQTYNQVITPMGGTGTITFTNPASVDGLTLATAGNTLGLAGTPTSSGSFPFTVSAQDSAGNSVSADYTLNISAANVTFTALSPVAGVNGSLTLAPGQVGEPYTQNFLAAGGDGSLAVIYPPGTANGLTFSGTGADLTLSGTPTDPGSFNYILYAQDSNGISSPVQTFTLNIAAAPANASDLTLVSNADQLNLPSGVQGEYYSQTLSAFGGTGTYVFSHDNNDLLPAGLSFTPQGSSYVLSGTPTASGSVSFTVTVTSGSSSVSQPFVLTIQPAVAAPLTLTREEVQPGLEGRNFFQKLVSDQQSAVNGGNKSQDVPFAFTASGGSGGYVFSATGLPAGMYVASNGVLAGTPAQPGTFPVTLTATDSRQNQASVQYPLTILTQFPFSSTPYDKSQVYTPAEILQAYGFNQIILSGGMLGTGAGQTIGVVEYGDDPTFASSVPAFTSSMPNQVTYAQSDMAAFSSYLGLPQFGSTTGGSQPVFLKLDLQGGTDYAVTPDADVGEWSEDVETIHMLAPLANIVVFVAPPDAARDAPYQAALNFSANLPAGLQDLPPITVISSSYSNVIEDLTDVNDVPLYQSSDPSQYPVTVVNDAGDAGYFPPTRTGPQFPSNSPNILSAAMTQLTAESNGDYLGEVGIAYAGGGVSQYLPQPSYQAESVAAYSTTQRVNPDVAFIGSYNSGTPHLQDGVWGQSNGSSNAAPGWAALLAIVNQAREADGEAALDGPTQTLPMLYQLPSTDFHSITQLDNGSAVPGAYNVNAGLGTPIANRVVAGLTGGHDTISGTLTSVITGAPLAGWTVFLDANGTGTLAANDPTATTDANGNYSFLVAPGSGYVVRVQPPTGWTQISANPSAVSFEAGQDLTQSGVNFTFAPAVTRSIFAVGAGAGGGPEVKVYDTQTGTLLADFFAFNPAFTGGVRVAVGDVNGDGVADIICAAGPGGGPNVVVFNGATFAPMTGPLGSFLAFAPGFSGGVYVAVGDVNLDGFGDIICGADAGGGPQVNAYEYLPSGSLLLINSFMAFDPSFGGGITIASAPGGITAVGAGPGGGPEVRVFEPNPDDPTQPVPLLIADYFAFAPAFTGGVNIGMTMLNGRPVVLAGAGAGGAPEVRQLQGPTPDVLDDFFAFDPTFTGGVYVG